MKLVLYKIYKEGWRKDYFFYSLENVLKTIYNVNVPEMPIFPYKQCSQFYTDTLLDMLSVLMPLS